MFKEVFKAVRLILILGFLIFGLVHNGIEWANCDGDYVRSYTWNGATCIDHK